MQTKCQLRSLLLRRHWEADDATVVIIIKARFTMCLRHTEALTVRAAARLWVPDLHRKVVATRCNLHPHHRLQLLILTLQHLRHIRVSPCWTC